MYRMGKCGIIVLLGLVSLVALSACSDEAKSEKAAPIDSIAFVAPGLQEWASLTLNSDTTILVVDTDTLKMWWSAEPAIQFHGGTLFANTQVVLSHFDGTVFNPLEGFSLDVPHDFVMVNVTEWGKYDFQIHLTLSDGRQILIAPSGGLALVSQVTLGRSSSSTTSSSVALGSSSSSSSSATLQVILQQGIWGGSYSKGDTSVTMLMQLNADQSLAQTVTYNWNLPTAGCRKLEYRGTWRQDLWILTLDRETVAEYSSCLHDWMGASTNLTEDPIAFSLEFQDANGMDILAQWPDANDWVQLSQ